MNGASTSLEINSLLPGIYLVKVTTGERVFYGKTGEGVRRGV